MFADGECVDHCKPGFFVDKEGQDCEPCHRACRTCGGPRYDDCDTCEEGVVLKNGKCLESRQLEVCPDAFFRNGTDSVTFTSFFLIFIFLHHTFTHYYIIYTVFVLIISIFVPCAVNPQIRDCVCPATRPVSPALAPI